MLRFRREVVIGVAVVGSLGTVCWRSKVLASPSTSPSAIHAARLKYTPPLGWIRHYLGDDRYKIDGDIWRVVSTQMDTYYHRPNCPNMLRQSADTVIGFPSGEDAVEAGYKPDPVCHPEEPVVEYGGAGGMDMSGLAGGGGLNGIPGQVMTLADGVSKITLPVGWQRLYSKASDMNLRSVGHTLHYSIDMFKQTTGRGMVMIDTGFDPALDLGSYFSVSHMRALIKNNQKNINSFNKELDSTGEVSGGMNQMQNELKTYNYLISDISVSQATVGGLSGVRLIRKSNSSGPTITTYDAGRGHKAYRIFDMSGGAPGVDTILKSFKAR